MPRFLLALIVATFATTGYAGEASERVFSRTALDAVADKTSLVYSHVRNGNVGERLDPIDNGEIHIELQKGREGSREAVVTMGETGKLRPVSRFPAASGNPLVPIFLESTLRTMARVTGGSEFYIRNRIKEALGKAGTMKEIKLDLAGKNVPATEIMFEPFKGDRNSHRMGPFATLTLTFVVSEQAPGDIVRFEASTGDAGTDVAYREMMTFHKLVEED